MSYQLYRNTTIGNALQDSLDILVLSEQLKSQQASKVLLQFDKSINRALATKTRSYVSFRAGQLSYYRFCDNVWTFMLKDVEFKGTDEEHFVSFKIDFVSYQLYRHTTLGNTLQEALDELIQTGRLKISESRKVLLEYDKMINRVLATQSHLRLIFKADRLSFYRCYNDVWTIILSDVKLRDNSNYMKTLPNLKIIAGDAKSSFTNF